MADQTSALIERLGLGRPDVLGWSMGGMIARALAVLHPAQVRRLVLCATYPGTGTVVPSRAAIVNGQFAVPAGGQLKVPTPRADHFLVRTVPPPRARAWRMR
jgi:pimeloyl-ACP methyl ester carboxylesterase